MATAHFDVWGPSSRCCGIDIACGHPGDGLSDLTESSRLVFPPDEDPGLDISVPPERLPRSPAPSPRRARLPRSLDEGGKSGTNEVAAQQPPLAPLPLRLPCEGNGLSLEDARIAMQTEDEQSPRPSEPKDRCAVRGISATDPQACVDEMKKSMYAELATAIEDLHSKSKIALGEIAAELRAEMQAALLEQQANFTMLEALLARQREEQASMQRLDQTLLVEVTKLAQGQDVMRRTMDIADLDCRMAAVEKSRQGGSEGKCAHLAGFGEDSKHEMQTLIDSVQEAFRVEVDRVAEMHESETSSLRGFLADCAEEHVRSARQDAKLGSRAETPRRIQDFVGRFRAHRMATHSVSEQFSSGTELQPDSSQEVSAELALDEVPEATAHYCISSPVAASDIAEDESLLREDEHIVGEADGTTSGDTPAHVE